MKSLTNNELYELTKKLLKEIDKTINWRLRRTKDKTGFYIYKYKGTLGAFENFSGLRYTKEKAYKEALKCIFDYDFNLKLLNYERPKLNI
jgi:nitrogen regulatory protein PII-like uncharacterized protein